MFQSYHVLPCPMCCNPPRLAQIHDEFVVECQHCGFSNQLEWMVDDDHEYLLSISYNVDDAVKLWNESTRYYLSEAEIA